MEHSSYPQNSLPQDTVMVRDLVKLQRKSNVPSQIMKTYNYIWLHLNPEENVELGRLVKSLVSQHKQSKKLSSTSQRIDYFVILDFPLKDMLITSETDGCHFSIVIPMLSVSYTCLYISDFLGTKFHRLKRIGFADIPWRLKSMY